jgi:hypothetical protein
MFQVKSMIKLFRIRVHIGITAVVPVPQWPGNTDKHIARKVDKSNNEDQGNQEFDSSPIFAGCGIHCAIYFLRALLNVSAVKQSLSLNLLFSFFLKKIDCMVHAVHHHCSS